MTLRRGTALPVTLQSITGLQLVTTIFCPESSSRLMSPVSQAVIDLPDASPNTLGSASRSLSTYEEVYGHLRPTMAKLGEVRLGRDRGSRGMAKLGEVRRTGAWWFGEVGRTEKIAEVLQRSLIVRLRNYALQGIRTEERETREFLGTYA
ncbi:hypothetical protein TREMEDRAFT_61341 [Tremella mesenterica DSM 1558]|uniref:uncharacterized protein n=1 Tax=Tremella mesenterica (strain ATCC 24925 / CBS 8224 / DSM 1558 / NBRC 9311 / NRRL Y-6157 / RJB 2259-6 / UBC 559-6) TaxID=578456 RepID=UPI0003F49E97|nr:uncharacterized protein TREMEDRAFT_61341 [Tremella mesenterica DSM 1558]EIW70835.1 hypothetical protein TREMEDRAFT_61341 [Tremella mesenterica DSM 1558]